MTTASAPGKVILCGEHAVVYGWPAIALPLSSVRATATVTNAAAGSGVTCDIPDSGERWVLADVSEQPLARLTALVFQRLGITAPPDLQIILRSTIPIASGMGSGAALGAALVKALAAHLGHTLTPAEVSGLVYEIERIYHGTPSGIDNTVVSYEQPIWFIRGNQNRPPIMEPLRLGASFSLVIGDTGTRAPTRVMVGAVRELWQRERRRVEALFEAIGTLAHAVRDHVATGQLREMGQALNRNQQLLRELGVSSPPLERLIGAAQEAGALGAKLSGGGGGGIMLALVDEKRAAAVAQALQVAGATCIFHTVVG